MQSVRAGTGRFRRARWFTIAAFAAGIALPLQAQEEEGPPAPISLKTVPVPGPSAAQIGTYVRDTRALLQLGKALFWDTQVGSDDRTACASCHFHAGADDRVKNQVSPGLLANDTAFGIGRGPNYTLRAADFPLTRFASLDAGSPMVKDVNDVVSSQGVFTTTFTAANRDGAADTCADVSDAVDHGGTGFNLNGVNTRRVEPRNTPTVFNAVFNFRNFWDGRAHNTFNGTDPFGLRNAAAVVWRSSGGRLTQEPLALPSSSLMSLASGPPLSENEMSCKGRTFANLARKLAGARVLADQRIDPGDGVLAPLARTATTYGDLVRRAFRPDYWESNGPIALPANGVATPTGKMDLERGRHRRGPRFEGPDSVTQFQANFAMFFALAVHRYLATLVSDQTPFDRFAEGRTNALSAAQQRGLALFNDKGQCVHCHAGAEFTAASQGNVLAEGRLDHRPSASGSGPEFRYDNGFFNTGVRPSVEDPGVGGMDALTNPRPLSETRLAQMAAQNGSDELFGLFGNGFDIVAEEAKTPGTRVATTAPLAVDGAFKTPGLRNVELTGPYFHNGGKSTLMQVIDFYNRGGDFGAANQPVPDPTIRPLGFTEDEKHDLVAFLLSLTDERVRFERAPFDHPSICVPNGHRGDDRQVAGDANGRALDDVRCIPAVGAGGVRAPLRPFLSLSPFER